MNNVGKIELLDMWFYAHHGCFEEEQIIGTNFMVDFEAEVDFSLPAESDNLQDAVNYQSIYNVIKREMDITSHLMEHVTKRILNAIRIEFPQLIHASISLRKLSPPLGGEVGASKVTMKY